MKEAGAPDTVSREASVEFEEALISEGFERAVSWAGVWEFAIGASLHLLNAGLDEVEGQTAR